MTEQNVLTEPQISADGHWRWDGTAWVPNAPQTTMPQPPIAPSKQKMGLGKKLLIGAGVVTLIAVGSSLGGNGDDEAATKPAGAAASTKGKDAGAKRVKGSEKVTAVEAPTADNTTATANGPLVWGNWETVGPVEPKENVLDMYDLAIRVKNTGDTADQGLFSATVLKNNRILATFDCISADEIAPGAITTVDCLSADDFVAGWDEITLEDSF